MQGFNLIDAIVAAVILVSAILAYSRGFVRETMAIIGWVAAAVVAFIFAPATEPLVKEVPVLSKFLGSSCELSMIVAFAGTFAVGLVVVSLFTPLFASIVQRSFLSGLDQGLGFLYGAARGILLVAVAFLVYHKAMAAHVFPVVDNSRSDKIFATVQTSLENAVPANAPNWIVAQYDALTSTCSPSGGVTTATAAPSATAAPAPATTTTTTSSSAGTAPAGSNTTINLGGISGSANVSH